MRQEIGVHGTEEVIGQCRRIGVVSELWRERFASCTRSQEVSFQVKTHIALDQQRFRVASVMRECSSCLRRNQEAMLC